MTAFSHMLMWSVKCTLLDYFIVQQQQQQHQHQFNGPLHKKCSGIKGGMYKVTKTFICRGCVNQVTGTVRTSVDIGVNANLELVDRFCYLDDTLSVDLAGRMPWIVLYR